MGRTKKWVGLDLVDKQGEATQHIEVEPNTHTTQHKTQREKKEERRKKKEERGFIIVLV